MVLFQEEDDNLLTFCVASHQDGNRLDRFLSLVSGLSRARVQSLLRHHCVTDNQCIVTNAAQKVKKDQVYHMFCPAPEALTLQPEKIDFEVIYEDCDLLVLNKPAHLVVHPGPGHASGTLVHGLLEYCGKSLSGIGGVKRPGIVHRLDKGTSGLLVVAKNDIAHQGLSAQFASKTLFRIYHAVVWGVPRPLEGTIRLPLGRHPLHRQKQAVLSQGREAVTHYRALRVFGESLLSIVRCRLETGRTHQIRVHLQASHTPLVGDPLYGRAPARLGQELKQFLKEEWPSGRPALHAQELCFQHPVSGISLQFKAPLPADMQALIAFCQTL